MAELFGIDMLKKLSVIRKLRTTDSAEYATKATIRNFRIVASVLSSSLAKMFFRCSLTVRTSTPNSSAMSFCDSQMVSLS